MAFELHTLTFLLLQVLHPWDFQGAPGIITGELGGHQVESEVDWGSIVIVGDRQIIAVLGFAQNQSSSRAAEYPASIGGTTIV